MSLLHIAGGATEDKLYVEDVFSTYLYTGTSSTQTINNGIDLAGKGGMVWIKNRTVERNNTVLDTMRGTNKDLNTNNSVAQITQTESVKLFNSNGFTLGTGTPINAAGVPIVSWTFRKAPKFFDVVTYTGNGVAGRKIPHSLGCEVGMIVVKTTSTDNNWSVYHRSTTATNIQYLDLTNATGTNTAWNNTEPISSSFTVGSNLYSNANGVTYVAYLFAHDPSAD